MAAPVVLHGYRLSEDDEDEFGGGLILASRDGEPSFVWVQDFGDACQAASARGVELHVPRALYAELVRDGEAPTDPLSMVRLI